MSRTLTKLDLVEGAWDAFLAESRDAVARSAALLGGDRRRAVGALSLALRARFLADPAGAAAPEVPPAIREVVASWLRGRQFTPADDTIDSPRGRALGPEAMARFHEVFAAQEGSVYTEEGEVRFMARRALAEHLAASFPEGAALSREKAFRLVGARDAALEREAARLAPEERRAAARRLLSLRALDPACGSAAFLIGLLREILRLRCALGLGSVTEITRHVVSASLFGVDVDPDAVDVARRRLTLAAPGARPNLFVADALRADVAGAPFDLVIGNPPYLRQERIDHHPLLGPGAKRAIAAAARARWGRDPGISRRADLYVYFFLEGLRLLRPGGVLVFLTSHAWLDLDYGAALRAFLLEEADLPLVAGTDVRSFRHASVNTTITVALRRKTGGRSSRPVRFAALRRPFADAAQNPLFARLDAHRATENASIRLRLVSPRELAPPTEGGPAPRWGGPWLRGPSVLLRTRDASAGRTVPLGEIAHVVFGLKTGCNDFFYLQDMGPGPEETRRCVSRLDGRERLIESRFLVPVVTTLKEIESLEVDRGRLVRRLLRIPPGAPLAGTRAAKYLRLGERRGVSHLASVSGRRSWFTLDPPRGALLLPRRIGERMPVARSGGVAFDNNLFGITPRPGVPLLALQAVLNAMITRLHVELDARELTGAQAVADTNVYLVKALPVPSPDRLRSCAAELARALAPLAARPARSVFEEVRASDRHALEARVIGLWGLPAGEIGPLQEALTGLVRARLEKAAGFSGGSVSHV